jgi:hypothetical protein
MPSPMPPTAVRIPRDLIARADKLRPALAREAGARDLPPSRHAVLLAAIREGIEAIERRVTRRK